MGSRPMTLSFWWQDAQRAVRFLRRHPLFALGVILVLAIGIGPVAALSSLMNVAFLRPWQVPEPDRLAIFRARTAAGEAYGEISIAEYRFLRQHSRSLSHIAARRSVAVQRRRRLRPASSSEFGLSERRLLRCAPGRDDTRARLRRGRGGLRRAESCRDHQPPSVADSFRQRPGHHRTHRAVRPAALRPRGRGTARVRRRRLSRGRRTDVWMPLPAGALLRGASPDLAQFADPRGDGPRASGRPAERWRYTGIGGGRAERAEPPVQERRRAIIGRHRGD